MPNPLLNRKTVLNHVAINKVFPVIVSNGFGGGDWDNGATWVGGVVPTADNNVVIADGDVVNVNVNSACNQLTIQADAFGVDFTDLTISGAQTFTVTEDIIFEMVNGATVLFTISNVPSCGTLILGGAFVDDAVGGSVTYTFNSCYP